MIKGVKMAAAIVFAALSYMIVNWKDSKDIEGNWLYGMLCLVVVIAWLLSMSIALKQG